MTGGAMGWQQQDERTSTMELSPGGADWIEVRRNDSGVLPTWRVDGRLGGRFDEHPWGTFDAPVIVEDQNFPAMRHFPKYLKLFDEMYSPRQWSRDKVNVLMCMDESKLDYVKPQYGVKSTREDKDQAIAWSKMYGKGRVFYSSFGHTKEAWDDPLVRKMYLEGIRWAMGRTEGSTASHPKVN